ncbi:hypothetical protein L6164_009324 [Bauhinia variegata]|uniref:Uncharacterized protein n=1 Tax=Bauhinia variegata TaxID=167791 RepID=A0ACB9PPX3_BAUVA|nr:hypothetical protein L6164_009324 [Bauhinia variegata]
MTILAVKFPMFCLHVIDLDQSSVTFGGWLEDTSLVDKYTISEEAYNKREGTFRKFKEKFASKNPSTVETKISNNNTEDLCANIKVRQSHWTLVSGVQYDEPLGKHDDMVKGVRYFDALHLMVQWLGQKRYFFFEDLKKLLVLDL